MNRLIAILHRSFTFTGTSAPLEGRIQRTHASQPIVALERLRTLLTPAALLHLGGEATFARGIGYAREQRVSGVAEGENEVTASVAGTETYRVRLWDDGGLPGFDCTCPVGVDLRFCKHCVAVALAWNPPPVSAPAVPAGSTTGDGSTGEPPTGEVAPSAKPSRRAQVRAFLLRMSLAELVELVMEQAGADPRLRARLSMRAASAAGSVDVNHFRAAIDSAFRTGAFVDYEHAGSYARRVDGLIGELRGLLDRAPGDVIPLAEHALARAEAATQHVDDSGGYFTDIFASLAALHLEACERASPLPAPLAARLFRRELSSEFDVFHRAAATYAHVLGREGLQAYRVLAEHEWEKVPELGPGDTERLDGRFRITEMMDALAQASGGLEARVAVRRRDLSTPYRFLQVAGLYADAEDAARAVEWAEAGLAAFPDHPDPRLRHFLAAQYARAGRHADALALVWADFAARPCLDDYKRLKEYAEPAGAWPEWRSRALALARERADAEALADRQPSREWARRPRGYTDLVRFHLWEGAVDEAWNAARQGGCLDDVWFELARRREQTHPADAIPIYQRRIEAEVMQTSRRGYEDAVRLLAPLRALYGRAGVDAAELAAFVARLRDAHRRKRSFIALLDRARLS